MAKRTTVVLWGAPLPPYIKEEGRRVRESWMRLICRTMVFVLGNVVFQKKILQSRKIYLGEA